MTNRGQGPAQASGPRMGGPRYDYEVRREQPGHWSGWVAFAAAILVLAGLFQVIEGLVALLNRTYYLVAANGLVVSVNYAAWGTIHLIVGILAVLAGFGVLAGSPVARVAGIVLAAVSALVNLGFLAAYPFWASIVIGLDVLVIYALAVHGREVPA